MNCLEAECAAKTKAIARHLRYGGRCFSSRSPNARIVKQNHLVIPSETVGYGGIPSVHVGVEVFQKEQRNGSRLAETTVGITDSIGLNKVCRDRFVCVIAHTCLSNPVSIRHCSLLLLTCNELPVLQLICMSGKSFRTWDGRSLTVLPSL